MPTPYRSVVELCHTQGRVEIPYPIAAPRGKRYNRRAPGTPEAEENMPKSLIIVESPAKTKTIKGFLGKDFAVEASMGHVMDLPKKDAAVDIEHDFRPTYEVMKDRKDVVAKLKSAAKSADMVYLASDPDREGEAISAHIREALGLEPGKYRRIQFNSLTRSAVEEGLRNPRDLDDDLYNAQQARRVLDRLVGFKISPLLWRKVRPNLSAGRVQSVAVRLVCDREREIQAFVPVESWSVTANLSPQPGAEGRPFDARLEQEAGAKIELRNQADADRVLAALEGASWSVRSVKKSE
ncbi:MAG: type IA DNA topoisomerase, partial [Armatimonadaceae bacterium]